MTTTIPASPAASTTDACVVPPASAAAVPGVDLATAQALLANGAVLIDVRRAVKREGQPRLPNAAWIPLTDIDAYFADDRASELGIDDPAQPILLFCASGPGSAQSLQQLQARGYSAVHYLAGGVEAWVAAGLPTAAAEV